MSGISRCSLDLAHQGYHYRDLQHNEMEGINQIASFHFLIQIVHFC